MKLPSMHKHSLWSPRRAGRAALLLVLCAGTAPAQEPLSWPNRAPYVQAHVSADEPAPAPLAVPVDVARAAQRRLHVAPPEDWGATIGSEAYGLGPRQHVVTLFVQAGEAEASFLVTSQSWNLLSDQNVSCLNQVLERAGRDLVASGFEESKKRRAYLDLLDGLTLGMGTALEADVASERLGFAAVRAKMMGGSEKNVEALRLLCHDVVVTREGAEVTFTYNLLCLDGSVVRRTVHARVVGPRLGLSPRLELLGLGEVELRSAGTFSLPDFI